MQRPQQSQTSAELPTLAQFPTDDTEALKTLAAGFPPTNTARPTQTQLPTVDSWGATGTALLYITASPTLDYCWWQTPSPTPTSTLPFTPDSWGATGTAIYMATNPYQTPTRHRRANYVIVLKRGRRRQRRRRH